jgi:hypothetical protein
MTTTTETTDEQLTLSISDLQACIQIIEICSSRGAFKADELAGVGHLYQKLSGFINQIAAAQATSEETPKE